jgi:hypothetical protein
VFLVFAPFFVKRFVNFCWSVDGISAVLSVFLTPVVKYRKEAKFPNYDDLVMMIIIIIIIIIIISCAVLWTVTQSVTAR